MANTLGDELHRVNNSILRTNEEYSIREMEDRIPYIQACILCKIIIKRNKN